MMRVACLMMMAGGVAMTGGQAAGADWPHDTLDGARPVVIAHRGASGILPEHTLEGYRLAIELGADFIEPDLVMTRDGHLVARHDRYLSTTTDVASRSEYAGRKRASDGRNDWFVEDFTLAEIRTLRAKQPFDGRDNRYDGRFTIPTFAEILTLLDEVNAGRETPVGVYPELKHPAHFIAQGLDPVPPLRALLEAHDYRQGEGRLLIQCFELETLQRLRAAADYPLVALIYPLGDDTTTPSLALEKVAGTVDAVGSSKAFLFGPDGASTDYVRRAHALGLAVHVWTLRDDRTPAGFDGAASEYNAIFAQGVDGIFTDFPASGVRERFLSGPGGKSTAAGPAR